MVKPLLAILIATLNLPLLCMAETDGDKLGRLFTTANERHSLSQLRQKGLAQNKDSSQQPSSKKTGPKKSVQSIVVNGIVKRTNGEKIVWINGKQVKEKSGVDGINLLRGADHNDQILVKLSNHRRIKLKPGQYAQINNGKVKVKENYLSSMDKKTDKEETSSASGLK